MQPSFHTADAGISTQFSMQARQSCTLCSSTLQQPKGCQHQEQRAQCPADSLVISPLLTDMSAVGVGHGQASVVRLVSGRVACDMGMCNEWLQGAAQSFIDCGKWIVASELRRKLCAIASTTVIK
jgi:hypothetical protein